MLPSGCSRTRSIWRRRPDDWRAVPPYLAMSYLYKRSNRLWHLLIRHRLTGTGLAAAGRVDAAAAPAIPAATGVADRPRARRPMAGAVVSAGV